MGEDVFLRKAITSLRKSAGHQELVLFLALLEGGQEGRERDKEDFLWAHTISILISI